MSVPLDEQRHRLDRSRAERIRLVHVLIVPDLEHLVLVSLQVVQQDIDELVVDELRDEDSQGDLDVAPALVLRQLVDRLEQNLEDVEGDHGGV